MPCAAHYIKIILACVFAAQALVATKIQILSLNSKLIAMLSCYNRTNVVAVFFCCASQHVGHVGVGRKSVGRVGVGRVGLRLKATSCVAVFFCCAS